MLRRILGDSIGVKRESGEAQIEFKSGEPYVEQDVEIVSKDPVPESGISTWFNTTDGKLRIRSDPNDPYTCTFLPSKCENWTTTTTTTTTTTSTTSSTISSTSSTSTVSTTSTISSTSSTSTISTTSSTISSTSSTSSTSTVSTTSSTISTTSSTSTISTTSSTISSTSSTSTVSTTSTTSSTISSTSSTSTISTTSSTISSTSSTSTVSTTSSTISTTSSTSTVSTTSSTISTTSTSTTVTIVTTTTISGTWLTGWDYRIECTIDNTKVDDTLEDFPVLLKISASSGITSEDITNVFSELGSDANRKKIAVTSGDGVSECYVEIERFDYANSVAWLWVKIPAILAGSATTFYLYYDADHVDNTDFVGDTTETPAQSVWDENFKLVMHMAQDPNGDAANAIKDSTSNANHGTPSGSMASADLVDGKIGKGIDFDGSNDFISIGSAVALSNDKSIEVVFKTQSTDIQILLSVTALDTYGEGSLGGNTLLWRDSNAKGKEYFVPDPVEPFDVDVWQNIVLTVVGGGASAKLYNGSTLSVEDTTGNIYGPEDVKKIAYAITTANRVYFKGQVCEIRISSTSRSAAWLKATYHSNWDELITFNI